jgi:hypothetical protein
MWVFCLTPQKGSFQSYGCKTYRKKKAFCAYVLRRRNWRKSGLCPVVAKLEIFATRAFWLKSCALSGHEQKGFGNYL